MNDLKFLFSYLNASKSAWSALDSRYSVRYLRNIDYVTHCSLEKCVIVWSENRTYKGHFGFPFAYNGIESIVFKFYVKE